MSASIWSPDGDLDPENLSPDYLYKRIWLDLIPGQTLVNFAASDPTFVYTPGLQALEVGIDGLLPLQPGVDYAETSTTSITLTNPVTDAGRLYATVGRYINASLYGLTATGAEVVLYPGNGVQTTFALGVDPGTVGNVDVSIDGATQTSADFNLVGASVVFVSPPPNGTVVYIRYGRSLPIGTVPGSSLTLIPSGFQTKTNVQALADNLGAGNGTAEIGYKARGANALLRTLKSSLQEKVSAWDYLSEAQIATLSQGAPALDLSAALQVGLNENANMHFIFPAGRYRIDSALNILVSLTVEFAPGAVLLLATQNMNGIVIGDGTDVTRNAISNARIINPAFNPYPGVTAFTSGACIFRNNVSYVDVVRPIIYGFDGIAKKLWQGIRDIRCIECDTPFVQIQMLRDCGVYVEGTGAATADRTADCNYDFARIIDVDGDAIYWGQHTAGLGCYRLIGYGNAGWAVHVNSTPGPSGQNYFITDIDSEAPASGGGGVYVESGQRVLIKGGWLGPAVNAGVMGVGIHIGPTADSCEIDVVINTGRIILEGSANRITGGEFSGDTVTGGIGILISGADNTIASGVVVRQFPGTGIDFSGAPARTSIGQITFKNNGTDIGSLAAFTSLAAPIIAPCSFDKTRVYTAASTVAVPVGMSFIQINGATTVNTIPPHGMGSILHIQAAAGGVTFGNSGNIIPYTGATISLSNFRVLKLVCDGNDWFESI